MAMNIRSLVKKDVARLRAYSAKEIPCRVKLDANESPYGFAESLKSVASISTNRYPDPEAGRLRMTLARSFGVSPENILQGNGSDELIYYLIATFGGPVLFPVPTFSMYGIISQALGENRIPVQLDDDFDIDLDTTLSAVRKERPKLIFLSSPNNPTGNCFSAGRVLKVIEESRGLVVVDEAYQPFSSEKGFLPLLRDFRNLVILRTLSKVGLAALRVGFLVAGEEIIAEVNKVRLPFNVNSFSQAVAVSALRDKRKMKAFVRDIVAERERMFLELKKVRKAVVFPTEANFILFRVPDAAAVHAALLKRGILVRNISDSVSGCLRVTVGTPGDNTAFLKALKEILA